MAVRVNLGTSSAQNTGQGYDKISLTEGVLAELDRALNDHELIKVQFRITEREDRRALIDELCEAGKCELVQVIGKMALIYRRNPKPNRNLSNSRFDPSYR